MVLDDSLVEDCGALPGWINRTIEILRQLDCRASVFDVELRQAMFQMIKSSSSDLKKKGSRLDQLMLSDKSLSSQNVNSQVMGLIDLGRLPSGEPLLKRRCCHPDRVNNQIDDDVNNTKSQISTAPTSSTLSPRFASPGTSETRDLFDSPDSQLSSSPITPTEPVDPSVDDDSQKLLAELAQPIITRRCSNSPESQSLKTHSLETHLLREKNSELFQRTTSPSEIPSEVNEPLPELSTARYFLKRKRALLLQKLSLLGQGYLFVKQGHNRLLHRYGSTPQQPAESACSTSRKLRSSVTSINRQSPGPFTRLQQQSSRVVEGLSKVVVDSTKPEVENPRISRASSFHSSGSASGTSFFSQKGRVRQRKQPEDDLSKCEPTQTTSTDIESEYPMEVEASSLKHHRTAHRTVVPKTAHCSTAPSDDLAFGMQNNLPSPIIPSPNLSQIPIGTSRYHSAQSAIESVQIGRPNNRSSEKLSHGAYEPLTPTVTGTEFVGSSENPFMKLTQYDMSNLPNPQSFDVAGRPPSRTFDISLLPTPQSFEMNFASPQPAAPVLFDDSLSLFTSYPNLSQQVPQHSFGMYDPRANIPPSTEAGAPITFSTPGIVSGQDPNSHPTDLFHRDQQVLCHSISASPDSSTDLPKSIQTRDKQRNEQLFQFSESPILSDNKRGVLVSPVVNGPRLTTTLPNTTQETANHHEPHGVPTFAMTEQPIVADPTKGEIFMKCRSVGFAFVFIHLQTCW